MKCAVDRLVIESTLESIRGALKEHSASSEIEKFKDEFRKLEEELSTGDWGRIGVIAGMLWYKLDMLIKHLSDIASSTHTIDRNTSKIK